MADCRNHTNQFFFFRNYSCIFLRFKRVFTQRNDKSLGIRNLQIQRVKAKICVKAYVITNIVRNLLRV